MIAKHRQRSFQPSLRISTSLYPACILVFFLSVVRAIIYIFLSSTYAVEIVEKTWDVSLTRGFEKSPRVTEVATIGSCRPHHPLSRVSGQEEEEEEEEEKEVTLEHSGSRL